MATQALRYAAFTSSGQGGNPAGVVLEADELTDADMLAIAHEIGYSETAFVSSGSQGAMGLRYFSPKAEVAFCGHATVATAVALADRVGAGQFEFVTQAGPVSVLTQASDAGITATLTSPPASTRPATDDELDPALAALGWARSDLDRAFPAHVAHAGNHHLVVGLAERATLRGFDYDYDALAALMEREQWTTVHVFWSESDTKFHARNAAGWPCHDGGAFVSPAGRRTWAGAIPDSS